MKLQNFGIAVALAALLSLNIIPAAHAALLDVSAFTAETGVTISGLGKVDFNESETNAIAFYFYHPNFYVDPSATSLSFDYTLAIGPENDDWLVVQIGEYPYEFETGGYNESSNTPLTLTGSASIDLIPFQNSTIFLAFGFEANDELTGSTAGFSNIQVNTVPLPPAILLMGCGLMGIVGARKKQRK